MLPRGRSDDGHSISPPSSHRPERNTDNNDLVYLIVAAKGTSYREHMAEHHYEQRDMAGDLPEIKHVLWLLVVPVPDSLCKL